MMKRKRFIHLMGMGLAAAAIPLPAFGKKTLPNVLLLGDSISIGYTPFVQEILKEEAHVVRPLRDNGRPENCAGTTNGIKYIDRWIGDTKWDLIHFNFGLHDLKHVDPQTGKNSQKPEDPRQAEPKQYKKNLREITRKLKTTGARLIFATTTPYPDKVGGPLRGFEDEKTYNKIALKIMKKHKIPVNDLHAFVVPQMEALQQPRNVHFSKAGSKQLAEEVAGLILEYLPEKTS